jgi:hypothetical protein
MMRRYVLSLYQPDGDPPPTDELAEIMKHVDRVRSELQSAGRWIDSVGLYPASSATVVRVSPTGAPLITDGPFTEGKEHIGGFTIIDAVDLEEALDWARRLAEASTLPVEVRPVHR